MEIRSLGYRTDLIFPAFEGEITDRGDHLVVRTPSNPTYYWGNFLLFAEPPAEGDFARWRDLFAKEIGTPPEVAHQAFAWDTTTGEAGVVEPFLQAGFEVGREVVLATDAPSPPAKPARSVNIRELQSEADRQLVVDLQVLCRDPVHEAAGYRAFRQRAMDRFRSMSEAGLGDWYGAFYDDQLVADLGVFHRDKLGRYQDVETHPEFRRRGIAGTLIYEAGRRAMSRYGLETLVIIADEDSAAARLYQSAGFAPRERNVNLLWFPHAGETTAAWTVSSAR